MALGFSIKLIQIFSVIFFISRIAILPNLECFVNQKGFISITEECRIAKSVIYKVLTLPGAAVFSPYARLMPGSTFDYFLSPDSSLFVIAKRL